MKDYDKNKELSVNNFDWIKYTFQFSEDLKKTIMKKLMKDIFLKLMFNSLKNCMSFIMIYYFYYKD